jgi:SAM-dependent methyltransferase
MDFAQFLKKAVVRLNKQTVSLAEYQKQRKIPMKDLRELFDNIQNRDEYLERFYKLSLSISPKNTDFEGNPPMKNKHYDNNTKPLFKNLIRNMHYEDILKNTKPGIQNSVTFMDMLEDLYLRNIIDYKLLTPSARYYMNENHLGSVFSSYYFRASIMNPYFVYSIQETLLKGSRIFTPTLGWTSYCYGFLESAMVKEYVGVDVIPSVCEKTRQFAKIHSPKVKTTIYCQPSETLANSAVFRKKYGNHFDVVFFSPPYYRLELYAGEQQSTEKYKSYEEWLENYWEATVELCRHVLKKGGRMCYVLSGYGSDKNEFKLIEDMNEITDDYFHLESIQPMYNKDVHVTSHKPTAEKIMLFIKK